MVFRIDSERRELLLQLFGMALRALGFLSPENNCFKLVAAGFATVFKNGHLLLRPLKFLCRLDESAVLRDDSIIETGAVYHRRPGSNLTIPLAATSIPGGEDVRVRLLR